MKPFISFTFILLLSCAGVMSQERYTIRGVIRDSATGEALIGATLYGISSRTGSVTDEEGHFSLVLNRIPDTVRVSFIGYEAKEILLNTSENRTLDIQLHQIITQTKEVVVTAKSAAANTESTRTGMVEISARDIRKLPALMGETDLIRALHYSPGVQTTTDGNAGFYVRGGNVDQNLILLDNALVYNPSHVLGFFSVFNSDVIGNATLIKSGMPAGFGGRISSVLNVRTIDGNFEKHEASATIGLIYSKAAIQGPILKNKMSYMVSFRKTYINELIKPILRGFMKDDSAGVLNGTKYGMYDLNAKIAFKPGYHNKFSLTAYKGRDNFSLQRADMDYNTHIDWGNTLWAFQWNYVISDSNYFTTTLNYSNYEFSYNANQYIMKVDLFSSIRNYGWKTEYIRNSLLKGSIRAGAEARFYTFIPNRYVLVINDSSMNYSSFQELKAGEISLFASWEKDMGKRFRLYAGLRYSNYRHLGPYQQINYSSDGVILDTVRYDRLKTIKSYAYPEPRISIRYQTGTDASLKASYTRNYQFIHIASASSVTMPSDIWIPSTSSTKPQFGDQFTLGYYRNFNKMTYNASIEAYYKRLSNQVELLYGMGASFQDASFEKSLTTGRGYSAGMELFVQKQAGKLTGSLSYSLSYTERQFDEINNGKPFPAKYDRRHDANLLLGYKLSEKWDFSMAFVYATGNAMTVPDQIYWFQSNLNIHYGKTNAFRMPAYHRMDISATYHFNRKGKTESSLNFSVFNVYNRPNPFLIFFNIEGDLQKDKELSISIKQISIFPIMPSISYSLKF